MEILYDCQAKGRCGSNASDFLTMSHKYFTGHSPEDFLSYRRDDLESTLHAGNPHAHPDPGRRPSGLVTPQTIGASVRVVGLAQPERQAQRDELSRCAFGTRAPRLIALAACGSGAAQTNAPPAGRAVSAGARDSMCFVATGRADARSHQRLKYQGLAPME